MNGAETRRRPNSKRERHLCFGYWHYDDDSKNILVQLFIIVTTAQAWRSNSLDLRGIGHGCGAHKLTAIVFTFFAHLLTKALTLKGYFSRRRPSLVVS